MTRQKEAIVPCGSCSACCCSPKLFAVLTPDEVGRYAKAITCGNGNWMLRKDDDGRCAYLVNLKCSIYSDRPSACRAYDCRLLANPPAGARPLGHHSPRDERSAPTGAGGTRGQTAHY